MDLFVGLTHAQCTRAGQRHHRLERWSVRIMTVGALESGLLTPACVPGAKRFAVHSFLPVAIGRAMALCTKSLYVCKRDGGAVMQDELGAVSVVVAVQAAVVQAVVQHNVGVLRGFSVGRRRFNESVTVHARLFKSADPDGRWIGKERSQGLGADLLGCYSGRVGFRHVGQIGSPDEPSSQS